ncbi:MAG: PP2C family protein-serine/threonine phosphatase [Planctomycetota bacterium]|jgi:serine phosphatase RsbU (regulator of sigma subunit)
METTIDKTNSSLSIKSEKEPGVDNGTVGRNRRILIIDDNEAIHEDFQAILGDTGDDSHDVSEDEAAIFGILPALPEQEPFEVDFAFQGKEGLEKIRQALGEGRPYSMAFVDIRMPPGWDGVETIQRIWQEYPELQVAICTAYSDYSWHDLVKQFGKTDKLLILKKPFDNIEVRQIACSQVEKWHLSRQAQLKQKKLETMVYNVSEQLRIAGLLQQDFLPTELPNTDKIHWSATFLPAEWVSGDIYDTVCIDEHHIGFYVADVVGHGISAALLTIFLKQALVMHETIGNNSHILPPSEVMKRLNSKMASQELSDHRFLTCCYCLLNTETLELTYVRGGHPYPVLIRNAEPPRHLEIKGSLLGFFKQAEYPQQTIQLQSGDKFLLYSDGAEPTISGLDREGNFYFKEEFCEIKNMGIVDMIKSLDTLVHDQKNTSFEVDDITIVGFEIL